MPSGGQIGTGNGIRLQAQTPGTQDLGNENISGDLIVGGFAHSYGGITRTNRNLVIGDNMDTSYLNSSKTSNIVLITGQVPNTGQLGVGGQPNTAIDQSILIGNGTCQDSFSVVIGRSNNCATGGSFQGGNVAIGSQAVCFNLGRTDNACSVAIGQSASASGNNWAIAIGTANAKAARCISIGWCGDPLSGNSPNAIIIDNSGPATEIANSIRIGNATHTTVKLGKFNIIAAPTVNNLFGTSDTTVANTLAKTGLMGAGVGSRLMFNTSSWPATVGGTARIHLSGIISSDAVAPSLTISMESDTSVVLATSAATLLPAAMAGSAWEFDGHVTTLTLGAGGTCRAAGLFKYTDTTGILRSIQVKQAAPVVLPTNTNQLVNVYAAWSAASVNNTVTATIDVLELMAQ